MNGVTVDDGEPAWRKLKLTLERPYTDDQGNPIRQLLDVTPEGQQIYEPYAPVPLFICGGYPLIPLSRAPDPNKQLAENIRRVFAERGHDFFEKRDAASGRIDIGDSIALDDEPEETGAEATNLSTQPMTPEQLVKMRSDIIPRLE
jgi:mediator of RNA polymerase II transcription subunit 17